METIQQKKSDKELKEYSDKIIDSLSDLNVVEKYKIISSLYHSLLNTIKSEGIIIEEDEN